MKCLLIFVFAAFAFAGPAAAQTSWCGFNCGGNPMVTPTSEVTDSNGMPLRSAPYGGGKVARAIPDDCFGAAMLGDDGSVHADWPCIYRLAATWRPDAKNENAAIAYLLKSVREGKAK
jgi:hypothetical protein